MNDRELLGQVESAINRSRAAIAFSGSAVREARAVRNESLSVRSRVTETIALARANLAKAHTAGQIPDVL